MNITYLSDSRIPSRTANSVHVMKMCQALARLGHQVECVSQSTKSDLSEKEIFAMYGVEQNFKLIAYACPAIKGGRLWYTFQIWRHLQRCHGDIDLVYSRSLYGSYAAMKRKLPFVHESHTPAENKMQRRVQDALLRSDTFQRLLVINAALQAHFKQEYPQLDTDRILLAPDGADLPDLPVPVLPAEQWRGREGALQVAYVGRMYPGRGLDMIVTLGRSLPEVDFHLIGGDRDELAQVPSGNIIFHGYVSPAETERYRQGCDVLLAPYAKSTASAAGIPTVQWMSPLKLFEYMASAKAIVASDLPAIREILQHDRTALLCDPEDSAAWKSAIQHLSDAKIRARLARAARTDLENKYQWSTRAEHVLNGIVLPT